MASGHIYNAGPNTVTLDMWAFNLSASEKIGEWDFNVDDPSVTILGIAYSSGQVAQNVVGPKNNKADAKGSGPGPAARPAQHQ